MTILMLMNSPNFRGIKSFYEKIGVTWISSFSDLYFYKINHFTLALNAFDTQESFRELLYLPENAPVIRFLRENSHRNIDFNTIDRFRNIKNDADTDIWDANKNIIPILRSQNIEDIKERHPDLGVWEKEKHGKGPEHYCLSLMGRAALEVYPVRKKNPVEDIELVFSGYNNPLKIEDVLGNSADPDGTSIIFL